jgi:hypothetical protein
VATNGLDHAGLVQLNPDGSGDTDFHPVRIAVGPDREDGRLARFELVACELGAYALV